MFNYRIVILVASSLVWGNCSCVLHLAMNSHPSTSRAYRMRSVINRERITCWTRRFYLWKNKKQTPSRWLVMKKEGRWIEGDLRFIKVNPGNVASFSLPLPPLCLSPLIRYEPYDRIFTSASNVLEEYIIHLEDYSQPLLDIDYVDILN